MSFSNYNESILETEKKHYGVEISRIINQDYFEKFREILKCKICYKLLNNPYDCANCGNSFCFDCINKLRENNKFCPFKCDNFTIKNSSFGIINILNSLKFYCFNLESGCDQEISYADLKDHDLLCKYANVHCPNVNCDNIIKRTNLEYHIKHECQSSLFKCDICKGEFSRCDFLNHYQTCQIISRALYKNTRSKNNSSTNLISLENDKKILNEKENSLGVPENINEFKSFMEVELKNLNLDNFLKILLFNLGQINRNIETKLENMKEELVDIRTDIKQNCHDINSNLSNMNTNMESEIDAINDRLSMITISLNPSNTNEMKKVLEDSFKDIFDKIDRKNSLETYVQANTSSNEDVMKELVATTITKNSRTDSNSNLRKEKQKEKEKDKEKEKGNYNNNLSSNVKGSKIIETKSRNKFEVGKKIKLESTSVEKKTSTKQNLNKTQIDYSKINDSNIINITQQNLKKSIIKEAISPKNRSPTRTNFQSNQNRENHRVKFDELKGNFTNQNSTIIRLRERSIRHNCGNYQLNHPIQTSYEAIQATLKNHELIIEYLGNIVGKIDKDLAKEGTLERCFCDVKEFIGNEKRNLKV